MDTRMQNKRQEELRRVAERASEWLEALEEGAGPQERAAFANWVAESPAHVREFLNIAAIDRLLADTSNCAIELEGLDTDSKVVALRESPITHTRTTRRSRWTWISGVAASITVITMLFWWQNHSDWREYATDVGEHSTVELDDGTVVNMNARTRLQVRFTDYGRDVRLISGEALFNVEQDAARPFRVGSGDAMIQAIGTRFNVNRRAEGTRVYVVEGRVRVAASRVSDASEPQPDTTANKATTTRHTAATKTTENHTGIEFLNAGEEAEVISHGRILKRTAIASSQVMAWRDRRLVFRSDTLQDIVTEFNRFNSSPKVRIEGDIARERRFTGVLDADKPESLMRFLARENDLVVDPQPGELVIRVR